MEREGRICVLECLQRTLIVGISNESGHSTLIFRSRALRLRVARQRPYLSLHYGVVVVLVVNKNTGLKIKNEEFEVGRIHILFRSCPIPSPVTLDTRGPTSQP